MKRPSLAILAMLCVVTAAVAAAAPPPPASAPAKPVELLDGGRVRITPPEGWTLVRRGADGLSLAYRLGDGEDAAAMTVIVTPQDAAYTRESADKMALIIGKQLRAAATASNAKILSQPRVIPDDRFFLKIHDRVRSAADDQVRDQVQIYRSMSLELLHVATVAVADNDSAAAPIHAAGAAVAHSAKLGAGPKPTVFRRTGIRMTIPPDWVEQRQDDPDGVVATFTHRQVPGAQIVLRAKRVPKDARGNADVQRNTVDMLVDDYRNAAVPEGASTAASGEEEPLERPPFARFVMRSLDWGGQAWETDFRVRLIGNVAIGVEALSPPQDELVSRLADQMALSIRPFDEKSPAAAPTLSPAAEKALSDRRAARRRAATQVAGPPRASHSGDTTPAPVPTTPPPATTATSPAP